MSPVLNCIPSSPPSEDTYPKGESVASDGSSHEINSEKTPNGMITEDVIAEESANNNNTNNNNNNNSIPLNFKKSTSPEGFEAPIRPWSSSPNSKTTERDRSVSPSSSGHRPSPCPASPDVSSDNSRIPSHTSSEAHDAIASPDSFRTLKMCDTSSDTHFSFHDNRLSDSFRLTNSFIGDPINPYLRIPGNPLNPFQAPGFLPNPFLGHNDPKLLLNNPNLGLISQQLHHLNGLSKIPPPDIQRMSMQQLQFLQNQLQSLPTLLHPSYSKFPDPKLSMLNSAKHPKPDLENLRDVKMEELKRRNKTEGKNRKMPERMEVNNYEDNSDSDELLSVGSASPPPNCQVLSKPETENSNGCGASDSSSSVFGSQDGKKYSNAVRLANNLAKPTNAGNRTLKFSIDNILKSDFGTEDAVKKPKQPENKKESERTSAKKKPETEKDAAVDLSQENANGAPGTDAPMLWPAWVYCTRYSDRPSSGPRTRRSKNKDKNPEEKRPRTAFSGDQLSRLKHEFAENRYLTERRRQDLARELGLNEAQIKIWFQNKRAKMKKARGEKNPLALQLMAQGLYNHSTVPLTKEEEEAAAAELSD